MYVGNVTYYYGQGTWFAPKDNGYEIVETPIAEDETLNVPELPYECSAVVVNGKTYYVGEGTWFIATDNGYQVVDVPTEGATVVESIAEDSKKIEVGKTDFFFADSKWYIPVEGGYMEIEEPIKIEMKSKSEANETKTDTTTAKAAPATRSTEAAPAAKIELPANAKTVDINGKKYYFANDNWYDKTVNGDYVIVTSPLK